MLYALRRDVPHDATRHKVCLHLESRPPIERLVEMLDDDAGDLFDCDAADLGKYCSRCAMYAFGPCAGNPGVQATWVAEADVRDDIWQSAFSVLRLRGSRTAFARALGMYVEILEGDVDVFEARLAKKTASTPGDARAAALSLDAARFVREHVSTHHVVRFQP